MKTKRAYPNDLRRRILNAHEAGDDTIPGLARRFMVSIQYAKKVIRQKRKTGPPDLIPQKRGTPRRFLAKHRAHLAQWLQEAPGLSCAKLKARFLDELGFEVSAVQIWRTVKKLDQKLPPNERKSSGRLDPLAKSTDNQLVEAKPEHGSRQNGSNLAVETVFGETQGEVDLYKKVHAEARTLFVLNENEGWGNSTTVDCRTLGTQPAHHGQKNECDEFGKQEIQQLRTLREENDRLKKIVAGLMLERQLIQGIVSKGCESLQAVPANEVGPKGVPTPKRCALGF